MRKKESKKCQPPPTIPWPTSTPAESTSSQATSKNTRSPSTPGHPGEQRQSPTPSATQQTNSSSLPATWTKTRTLLALTELRVYIDCAIETIKESAMMSEELPHLRNISERARLIRLELAGKPPTE